MTEITSKLPESTYSSQLKKIVFRLCTDDPSPFTTFLFKLLDSELSDSPLKNIKNQDETLIVEQHFEKISNKEIVARWNDFQFLTSPKNKVKNIQEAVDGYIEVYNQTREIEYLSRAFQLIKKTKSTFEDQVDSFSKFAIQEIKKSESSYYKFKILNESYFLNPSKFETKLKGYFNDLMEKSLINKKFSEAKNYIESLFTLKVFTSEECKIQIALCLEAEADHYTSQKEENTYYPNILTIYTNSLRTLKGVNVSYEVKNRIEQKIKNEQLIHSEMLRKVGISTQSTINFRGIVKSLEVEDFKSGYQTLLSIPIIESTIIGSDDSSSNKFFFSQFFKDYVHYSNKGTVTGITDRHDYELNFSRNHCRNHLTSIIREIKYIMDFNQIISKEFVSILVETAKSKFIPSDRIYLFVEGIYQGFKNNYIVASHILIPQIENSLKYIIELNGRNTIRLSGKIQNDNTLGSILAIEEESNKMLNGICEKDLLMELNSFLVDGNSINFRNQICHGLIDPLSINYYGVYAWLLTLKLIIQTEKFLNLTQTKKQNTCC